MTDSTNLLKIVSHPLGDLHSQGVYYQLYFVICKFSCLPIFLQECARTIKWGGICFAITEISFFILRQGFKVTPTPKVPHLSTDEQPFEMNIYKTLYYFLFTIVGGLIYICILFLYLQQLSKGQDEFSQFFNITARAPWSTPTPTTTTQAPQPPPSAQQDPHHLPPVTTSSATNNNSSLQSNLNPGGQQQQQGPQGQGQRSSKHSHSSSKHHHSKGGPGDDPSLQQQQHLPHSQHNHASNVTQQHRKQSRGPPSHQLNLVDPGPGSGGGPILSPPPPMDPGVGPMGKDPCGPGSPSSPMFPYFLMRRGSKQPPPPPPPHNMNHLPVGRCLMDEPPPPLSSSGWHGPPHGGGRGPPPMPPLRGDFSSLDPGGPRGSESLGVGRNLLSPSRLVVNHGGGGHGGGGMCPPQFAPIIPPFYPDSGEDVGRRDSFQGSGFGSPHYQSQPQSGYSSRAGGGPESLYQKIPMSPGFDYCLR